MKAPEEKTWKLLQSGGKMAALEDLSFFMSSTPFFQRSHSPDGDWLALTWTHSLKSAVKTSSEGGAAEVGFLSLHLLVYCWQSAQCALVFTASADYTVLYFCTEFNYWL